MDSRKTPDGLLMDSMWTPDTVSGVYLDSIRSPSGSVAQCQALLLNDEYSSQIMPTYDTNTVEVYIYIQVSA